MKIKKLFTWLFSIVFIIVVSRSIRRLRVKKIVPTPQRPMPSIPKVKASPVEVKRRKMNRKERKKRVIVTKAQIKGMISLRKDGVKVKAIAELHNVSEGLVYKYTATPPIIKNPLPCNNLEYYKPISYNDRHKLTDRLYNLLLKQPKGKGYKLSKKIRSEVVALYVNSSATITEISDLTGISVTSIFSIVKGNRFNVRKITANGKNIYTPDDNEAILRLFTGGTKVLDISESLDIPLDAVQRMTHAYKCAKNITVK